MPIQRIVSIILRLFCIQWVVMGISYLFPLFSAWNNGYDTHAAMALYYGPVAFIVIALVFWVLTPVIAMIVTKGEKSAVNISGLTRHDLYCFAFVLMGLNFVLSNLSAALTHLYQFIVVLSQSRPSDYAIRGGAFYELARYTVSLAAGGIAVIYANRISTRLIRMEQKRSKADEAEGPVRTVAGAADAPLP